MKIEQVKLLSPEERLLYWITERESIRLKKEAGNPKPWTDDVILQSFRFCNVRRMDDKVSQWLLKNWYQPYEDHPNMLAAVAMARFLNLPSSLALIQPFLFHNGVPRWGSIKRVLRQAKEQSTIFNGAYMVRGNDGVDKVECVIEFYVRPLVEKTKPTVNRTSMRMTWEAMLPAYGLGSFMAGQIVSDLRWSLSGDWNDRRTWAPIGPGSKKGMNYLHSREAVKPLSQKQFLNELLDLIGRCEKVLPTSITKRLEAMDYQNCLCEYRAYVQALEGIKNPKRRYS